MQSRGVCAWCGEPAVGTKRVQRAVVRKKDGAAKVIASESRVPACRKHQKIEELEEPVTARARYASRAKVWKNKQEKLWDD